MQLKRLKVYESVQFDGANLFHEQALLCMQRIVASGSADGSLDLFRDLVPSNINTHKSGVVFKSSAHHLINRVKILLCKFA